MGNRSSRKCNQQGPTFSGNCQFTPNPHVPPPLLQTSRSSFPDLIGMNASEASGRLVQMGLQPETIAPGQTVTADLRRNRVRLTVNRNGDVIYPVPRRG